MSGTVAHPSNRFLVRQRDRRWLQALASVLVGAVALLAALTLVGWPRLRLTSIHYDLVGLRAEVHQLEQHEQALVLELQHWRDPIRLSALATARGLSAPDPSQAESYLVSEIEP
jgi:hypothetical protein